MAFLNRLMRLYAVAAAFYLGVYKQMRWRWWPLSLASNFMPWLMLPAVPLMGLMTLRGWWKDMLLLAPAAAYFMTHYAWRYMPRPSRSYSPHAKVLTVFSYNTHAEERHLEEVATVIREANADVVALQEVSVAAAAYLSKALGEMYPHQRAHHGTFAMTDGQAVLSRFPICEDEYWQNPINSYMLGHQRSVIEWEGVPITVYNLHPIHPGLVDGRLYDEAPRGQEIEIALERAHKESGPLIWMGDFNMCDESDDYDRIRQHFRDAYRDAGRGLGLTFPDLTTPQARDGNSYPVLPVLLIRLDYVFINAWWAAAEAKVWPTSGGSDHRPVWARLILTKP